MANQTVVHVDGPDGFNLMVMIAPTGLTQDEIKSRVKAAGVATSYDIDKMTSLLIEDGFSEVESVVVDL